MGTIFFEKSENSFETLKECLSRSIGLENHLSPSGNKTCADTLRKPNFRTKNIYFQKTHNAKWGPFGLFQHPFCYRISKILKGGPLETLKSFRKKSLTVPKKLKGGPFSLVRLCKCTKKCN